MAVQREAVPGRQCVESVPSQTAADCEEEEPIDPRDSPKSDGDPLPSQAFGCGSLHPSLKPDDVFHRLQPGDIHLGERLGKVGQPLAVNVQQLTAGVSSGQRFASMPGTGKFLAIAPALLVERKVPSLNSVSNSIVLFSTGIPRTRRTFRWYAPPTMLPSALTVVRMNVLESGTMRLSVMFSRSPRNRKPCASNDERTRS